MNIRTILSAENATVKRLRSLKDRKGREATGLCLVEGEHCVAEALASGLIPEVVMVSASRREAFMPLLEQADERGADLIEAPDRILEGIGDTRSSQGIVAAVPHCLAQGKVRSRGLILALDRLQDPGNVGTMIRTADACGASAVLLSDDCADALSPKVMRSAMGSLFHLPVHVVDDLPEALHQLVSEGAAVLCGRLDGEDFLSRRIDAACQVLIIGNEGRGVSEATAAAATHAVRLPMAGQAESFNAAVSCGIMLYDMARAMAILS